MSWDLNLGSLEKQDSLLTTKPPAPDNTDLSEQDNAWIRVFPEASFTPGNCCSQSEGPLRRPGKMAQMGKTPKVYSEAGVEHLQCR